jgi:hypothetical protein
MSVNWKVDLIDFFKNSKGKIRAFKRPRRTRKNLEKRIELPLKIFQQ